MLLPLAVLFWAGNIVIGRAIHGTFPPIALTFWRWVLAFLIALPFTWRRLKVDLPALKAAWPILLALSVLGISTYNALGYKGLATTTAINAALLQSAMSPLVVLFGFVLFRERAAATQLLGVAVSILGVMWIVAQGSGRTLIHLRLNIGDLLLLAALASYALYTVLLRKKPAVHPLSLLASTFLVGSLILLPFYGAELASGERIQPGLPAAGALLYVAVFPSLVAYLFFVRGVEVIGAARAGQFVHLMPVFAPVLAMIFLGERLHLFHLVGAAIIGLGILIASRSKSISPPATGL